MLQTSPTQLSPLNLKTKRLLSPVVHRSASHQRRTRAPYQLSVALITTPETSHKNRQAKNPRRLGMLSEEQSKSNMLLRSPRLHEENTLRIENHAIVALAERKSRVLQSRRSRSSQFPSRPRRSRLSITTSLYQDISLVPLRIMRLSLEHILPPQCPRMHDRQRVVLWPLSTLVVCPHGALMDSQWLLWSPQPTPKVV